jgi:NAD(P)-dependent dehydrogenase (short-subunit alcohol dehydrogenase family)
MTKRVVVVGGAGAIGSALVRKYLNSAYEVIVGDVNKEAGERLEREANGLSFIAVDVLSANSLAAFAENLRLQFGSITHLVSLAGGALAAEYATIETCPMGVISTSIDLNLKSHLNLIKMTVPLLRRSDQDATITLISSINALRGFGLPAYSAAKAGLIGLVISLAEELGREGVRINAVLPGTVPTARTLSLPKDFKRLQNSTVLGRFATPNEISEVVFALTESMTCVTGQAIVADCGQTVRGISERH